MELSRRRPCIALAAALMLVAATSTPLRADPSQRSMDAVQAAVREMRDQLQARLQCLRLQARLRRAAMRHATLTGRYGRADPATVSPMRPYNAPIRCW